VGGGGGVERVSVFVGGERGGGRGTDHGDAGIDEKQDRKHQQHKSVDVVKLSSAREQRQRASESR